MLTYNWDTFGIFLSKQYLPLKRSRFGIKLYKLCESKTGYIYRFFVYVGKSTPTIYPPGLAPPPDFGQTKSIVWYLMLPLFDIGHCLYVDNFYTSLPLFWALYILTGRHFPMKIPPAPDKTEAMKKCKVCHKKKKSGVKAGTLVNSVHLNLVSALTIASVCTTARESTGNDRCMRNNIIWNFASTVTDKCMQK